MASPFSITILYSQKNEGANLAIDSLLGGGYLRLPMSLTIVVVTLRALCQERDEAAGYKKRGSQPCD